jgi:hypothetical protein
MVDGRPPGLPQVPAGSPQCGKRNPVLGSELSDTGVSLNYGTKPERVPENWARV